jgi:hypothetical protein
LRHPTHPPPLSLLSPRKLTHGRAGDDEPSAPRAVFVWVSRDIRRRDRVGARARRVRAPRAGVGGADRRGRCVHFFVAQTHSTQQPTRSSCDCCCGSR